jgi:hypothetical protein
MRLVGCLIALASTASAITIDPASYGGRYIISGPGFRATSFVGKQILPLADGSYAIDDGTNVCCALGTSSSFEITIAGGAIVAVTNQVTAAPSSAASASGDTLTFNPVAVDFDPGTYTGRWFVTAYEGLELKGAHSLQLLPDLEYGLDDGAFIVVSGAPSGFLFALDGSGDVTIGTPAAAVASGSSIGFNSATLSVDPGSYTGNYASCGDPSHPLSGLQPVTFINGLVVYLMIDNDAEYFVPPAAASLSFSGGETLTLSLASQAASTPGGSDVQVPVSSVNLTFSQVTSSGTTSVAESGNGQPPPSGFKVGSPPTYFDISTSASFSGAIQVCIDYSAVSYGNAKNLRLFHLEGGTWVDRTSSNETDNHIICAGVTSLSPFAVFEAVATPVRIDLQPDVINLRSRGEVPVVVFSSPDFDATSVDPMTLLLGSAPVTLLANGRLHYRTSDIDGDGRLDLVAYFNVQAMHLSAADTSVTLTGKTSDGEAILGSDTVRVMRRGH